MTRLRAIALLSLAVAFGAAAQDGAGFYAQAQAAYAAKDYAKAASLFELGARDLIKGGRHSDGAVLLSNAGLCRAALGQRQEAQADYAEAAIACERAGDKPGAAKARNKAFRALLQGKTFLLALREKPSAPGAGAAQESRLAAFCLEAAKAFLAAGMPAEAKRALEEGARMFGKCGYYEAAAAALRGAAKPDLGLLPADGAELAVAETLLLSGRYAEAYSSLSGLARKPEASSSVRASAESRLARLLLRMGAWDQALALATAIGSQDPDQARLLKGEIYAKQGRSLEAEKELMGLWEAAHARGDANTAAFSAFWMIVGQVQEGRASGPLSFAGPAMVFADAMAFTRKLAEVPGADDDEVVQMDALLALGWLAERFAREEGGGAGQDRYWSGVAAAAYARAYALGVERGDAYGAGEARHGSARMLIAGSDLAGALGELGEAIELKLFLMDRLSPEMQALFLDKQIAAYEDLIETLLALGRTEEAFLAWENRRAKSLAQDLRVGAGAMTLEKCKAALPPGARLLSFAEADRERAACFVLTRERLSCFRIDLSKLVTEILEATGYPTVRDYLDRQGLAYHATFCGYSASIDAQAPADPKEWHGRDKPRIEIALPCALGLARDAFSGSASGREGLERSLEALLGKALVEPAYENAPAVRDELVLLETDGYLDTLPLEILTAFGEPWCLRATPIRVPSLAIGSFLAARPPAKPGDAALVFSGIPYSSSKPRAVTVKSSEFDATLLRLVAGGQAAGADGSMALGYASLQDLPGTAEEAKAIVSAFPRSASWRGSQASKPGLMNASASGALAKYGILHFAVHGIFHPLFPAYSSLALASGTGDGISFMDASEITGLKSSAGLVVLSACETARGSILKGEGVNGLVNAFWKGGARNVVAALWPVSDQGASSFMRRFYENLAAGLAPPRAFNEARAKMLDAAEGGGHRGLAVVGAPENPNIPAQVEAVSRSCAGAFVFFGY